jgi:hypothetical protein
MIAAPGHERLITHVSRRGGRWLDSDAVFGVRPSLIADWIRHDYVHSSATADDRATFVEPACTGHYDYTALIPLARAWRVWGDTALCNGDVRIRVTVKGTPKEFVSRYLQVWRRGPSGWQMASWQSTPVPA